MSYFNEDRTYGIEIEFVSDKSLSYIADYITSKKNIQTQAMGYNHNITVGWKVITDSSCGYELVSPILKGRDGLYQLEKVCEALSEIGAKVNKKCGLHVHHGINDYEIKDIKNLFAMYAKLEKNIDDIVPKSRRGNSNPFLRSLSCDGNAPGGYESNVNDMLNKLKKCKTIRDLDQMFQSRYRKLNFRSYIRYGTIEFRQHSGTIDFEKIKNWILLTQQIVDVSKTRKVSFKYSINWEKFGYFTDYLGLGKASGCGEELREVLKYYKKRKRELV